MTKEIVTSLRVHDGVEGITLLRVSEITGKSHKNVMRDFRKISSQVTNERFKFVELDFVVRVKNYSTYLLNPFAFDMLIGGYSVKHREALISELYDLREENTALKLQQEKYVRELTRETRKLFCTAFKQWCQWGIETDKRVNIPYAQMTQHLKRTLKISLNPKHTMSYDEMLKLASLERRLLKPMFDAWVDVEHGGGYPEQMRSKLSEEISKIACTLS